jgi:hypothetical protein
LTAPKSGKGAGEIELVEPHEAPNGILQCPPRIDDGDTLAREPESAFDDSG